MTCLICQSQLSSSPNPNTTPLVPTSESPPPTVTFPPSFPDAHQSSDRSISMDATTKPNPFNSRNLPFLPPPSTFNSGPDALLNNDTRRGVMRSLLIYMVMKDKVHEKHISMQSKETVNYER